MRVARVDFYQPGVMRKPEIGPVVPRHECSLDDSIEYFKRFERVSGIERLPATFPVLERARLTFEDQPPLTLVLRDCGTY